MMRCIRVNSASFQRSARLLLLSCGVVLGMGLAACDRVRAQAIDAPPATVEAATSATNDGDPVQLEFKFREQKWIDVLDWFARQADLSLVVNELPPGTFTYSDTRSYAPNEALDLLNGVLGSRGFALIRRNRMLVCANLNTGIPEGLIPRVTLEELDKYGQFELVEVMFPLGKRPAQAVAEEVTPLLGKYGKATVLPQTSQLLVVTTAGTMRAVSAIISSIPEPTPPTPKPKDPPPPPPQLTVYPAKDVDAKAAVDMIKSLVGDAKLTIDDRSGQINAYATPAQHEVIAKLLQQMSTSAADEIKPRLELYDVQHESPSVLMSQLRLIVPQATLNLDSDGHRLLAFATPSQQTEIANTLQKLQADAGDPEHQRAVVYSLRHADPTSVSTMLQTLLPRAKVTVDAATKRLVVLAHTDQQTTARQFIEQLETPAMDEPSIRYYPVETEDAGAAQSLLQSLIPAAKLTYERDPRQLMVVATPADHARIVSLLKQLQSGAERSVPRVMQRHDVTNLQRDQFQRNYVQLAPELSQIKLLDSGSPNQLLVLATAEEQQQVQRVLEQIKTQFPEPARSLHFYAADAALRARFNSLRSQLAPDLGQIQIVEDPQDPRLGIVADESQHLQIQLLLDELQRELPKVEEQLRVFSVTPTQRTRFTALQPSLAAKLGSIRVLDESRPHELVVWGTPTQLELIESLLPSLQAAEPTQERELVAYPLRDGDPATVRQVLSELYPDLKIIVDAESRRVMVWTTAEQHQVIDRAIQQLDAPTAAGKNRMSYYRLVDIDARDVSRLLSNLVPKMSIAVDRDTNSIIAWGSEKDHALVAQSIEQFKQQQAEGANQIVSYPTGTIDPQRMRRLLGEVIPRARIVSDEGTRQILVWASPEDHRAVEQTLKEATRQTNKADATLEVYRLTRIPAANAVTLLAEIAPTAKVTTSTDGMKLLVWTTESQHAIIKQAIAQIEAGEATDSPASARAYRSEAQVVKQIEQLLPNIAPGARMLPDSQAGLLLLWATEKDHTAVAKMMESLSSATATPSTSLVTYTLQRAKPTQARELIQNVAPDARFLSAEEPQQLLIQATEGDHALIRSTLEQLEQAVSAPSVQAVRVYALGKSLPSTILSLLPPELLQSATVIPDTARNALIIRASDARHEELAAALAAILHDLPQERRRSTHVYRLQHAAPTALQSALASLVPTASLSVDNETRSLLATAYEEDHEQIQTAVQQLDQPQTARRQTRVFKLESRDFFGLRSALQELVPNATVASDRSSRMMLVTASATDLQRVEEVMSQLVQGAEAGRSTHVYRLTKANVNAAGDALDALLPNASIRADDNNRVILVTADKEDQQRAAAVIEQLENAPPDDLETAAYPLKSADVRAVRDALRTLLPQATVDADPQNRTVVVTCRADEQQRVKAVVAQLDQANAAGNQTKVYRLQYGDVNAARNALEDLLPRGSIAADTRNRALIVTASEADQQRVQEAVSQLDTARQDPTETRVYPLQRGDVVATQRALQALLPDAIFANDPGQRTLIATATPDQHERIAVTVNQMDRRSTQEPTLQAYSVTQANLTTVLNSLKSMYDRNPNVALTADETSHSILVKAAPSEQQTIAQVVSQMENSAAVGDRRSLSVYDLPGGKNDTLLTTLQKLFEKQTPLVDLSFYADSKQLIAVATPAQHEILSGALRRLQREPVEVEVFQLQNADPFSVELAIAQLYEAESDKPIANGDSATQQLFVRGTRKQIDEVRQLLEKMGELPTVGGIVERGTRVVPMRGDLDAAIEQLKQVWPKLRSNPLHVVPPAEPAIRTTVTPLDDSAPSTDPASSANPPAREGKHPLNATPVPASPVGDEAGSSATLPDESTSQTTLENRPVVVIPKSGAITLLSEDEAALGQAETLLRTLARQNLVDAGAGNFAVFSLRNAGARSVAKLLTELFEQMPLTTRTTVGRVSMVADDRLNAVVVHGRAADRNVIAELLQVLDSANVPDSLANARPRIVPVEYMEADRVLTILRGVYESQLKAGGNRPEIEIPRGISDEVATLLQQINASSSGPLLTLEIDDVTNSIVVLAPPQLSTEVSALIQTLDTNAKQNDARDVGIVTLRGTNVKQLKPAIDQLLRPTRRRRP